MRGKARRPGGIVEQVDHGVAGLYPDFERPGCWTLVLDGYPQSYVDIEDPGHLEFEYMRRLASIVDFAAPDGVPLRVLHLGGGALSLPRYIAMRRPRSVQRVVELDARLIEMVRRLLPLPRGVDIRVRAADAREVVETSAPHRFDIVVCDVYSGARVPGPLATVEFATAVARVLRPDGIYAINLADGAGLAYARGQVATLRRAFVDVCMLAEAGVLRGRRFGNVVLAGSPRAGRLPVADLASAAARDMFPARLVHGADLDRFMAGAAPVTDAEAVQSPAPPGALFGSDR